MNGRVPSQSSADTRDKALATGQRIRVFRKDQGLSLAQLGVKAGVPAVVVGSYERGERNIHLMRLFEIAAALGVDARDLLPPPHRGGDEAARAALAGERLRWMAQEAAQVADLVDPR